MQIRKGLTGVLVLLAALTLTSCLGVEMELSFEKDGSGQADMTFHISQIFFQLDPESQDVPVPITKEELEETYKDAEGVTVLDVTEENTEEKKIITASIAFDDFKNLSAGGDDDMFQGSSLTKEGGRTVFRTVLKQPYEPESAEAQSDPSQEEMVKQYFAGYNFIYRVRAPKRIRSHSIGELSEDGRVLSYEMPMYDFNSMKNSEPLVLELSW